MFFPGDSLVLLSPLVLVREIKNDNEEEKMSENDISLNSWVESEIIRLKEFASFWRLEREKNEEHFPMMMPPGEWDEQYRAFGN